MDADTIAKVAMELIGPVGASGDYRRDDRRCRNLKKMEEVCDLLLEQIFYASLNKDSTADSMKQIGAEANSYLRSEYQWLRGMYEGSSDEHG